MIDKRTIFEIHRLKHLGWSERKIARHLRIDRSSVKKYVGDPVAAQKRSGRASKLDPYRNQIKSLLDEDPTVSAPVVLQHLIKVRFNDAFLDFLRHFAIEPIACNPGAPYEKGKVESGVKYLRRNFMSLRSLADLNDVQHQALNWPDTVANVRIHQTNGQRPADRFEKVKLNPLPNLLPDVRETQSLLVHKDFAVRFDGNTYTAPPWTIGKTVAVKADPAVVSLYLNDKRIAVHPRCWERKKRIETPSHRQQVKKLRKKLMHDRQVAALMSLGAVAVDYLNGLLDAGQPIKKQVKRLLVLKDKYGAEALVYALTKSMTHKAFGADYVENIVHQEMAPKNDHPPVRLKNEDLNQIRLNQPSLAEYDTHVLKERGK